jgi:hypothetical protein
MLMVRRVLGAVLSVFALAGCGDGAPPPDPVCVSEPTLACVTEVALRAAASVMEVKAQRDFLSLNAEPLLDLAKAVNKSGQAAGRAWMAEAARALPTNINAASTARVLAATGQRDAALALVKQSLADDAEHFRTRTERGQFSGTPLSHYVGLLVSIGFPAEAGALLKGWVERERPGLAKLDAEKRTTYLGDGVLAFTLIGDTATARNYAEQAAAALVDVPEAEGLRIRSARDFAATLLEAGMPEQAAAVLQITLAEIPKMPQPERADERAAEIQRLMLRAQIARKDAAGAEAARAALRALRAKAAAARGPNAIFDCFEDDFRAALAAGDRGEAQRIRDEALALLAQVPKGEDVPELALRETAAMQATFGDGEGALATVRRVKDDPTDWKIPAMIARMCRTLSDNGHIVPALRCAAHLTDKRPLYLQRRLETYAKIAADLAR